MKTLNHKAVYAALVLALSIVAMPNAAHADWRHNDRRYDDRHYNAWHEHERHAYEWRRHHPHYEPGYVYAPPPVVEAPSYPGINLIVPLHIH